MPWKRFAAFNAMGAALWVTAISLAGYFFGRHWGTLMRFMKRFDLALGAVFILVAAVLWWRNRKK
jgi:membrane protein DedA with SNARE-associated domain